MPPAAAFAQPPAGPIVRTGGTTMGTEWRASVAGGSAPTIAAIVQPVLDRIVMQMSHWEAGSTLSRVNRTPIGRWIAIEPDFAAVMAAAVQVAQASNGAFDFAAGALVDLWGFGPPGPRDDVPPDADIANALARSGWDGIEWDAGQRRLRRLRDVRLDLSGIAKGHAVDAIATALVNAGYRHHLVEIGGEFVATGIRPDRQPWWVEVEAVADAPLPPFRIAACGVGIATSGDYLRRFVHDDTVHAHSIDARTGRPVPHAPASVTVIADSAMLADGWATALTVLPPDEAEALAVRQGLMVRIVRRGSSGAVEWLSPALSDVTEV